VRVAILDRPRNADYVAAVREAGAEVVALPYADLSACIGVALQCANLDLLVGIGGCPEGVIAATAASALGAPMQARLWARSAEEERWASEHGLSMREILDAPAMVGDRGLGVVLTGVTGSVILDPARDVSGELTLHTVRIDSDSGATFRRTALRRP
jgi:fructose-1,6-bisphosphatase II